MQRSVPMSLLACVLLLAACGSQVSSSLASKQTSSTTLAPTTTTSPTTTTTYLPAQTTTTTFTVAVWRSIYQVQLNILTASHNVCVDDINNLGSLYLIDSSQSAGLVADCQTYEDKLQRAIQWTPIPDAVAQGDFSAANKLNFSWVGKAIVAAEQDIDPSSQSNVSNQIDLANNFMHLMTSQFSNDQGSSST